MNLANLRTRLQNDPDSIPWGEKTAIASMLTQGVGWKDKLSAQAVSVLLILAGDSKWEVRKAVADILHLVPESHFNELAGLLGSDNHHFVRSAAHKAVDRRSKSQMTRRKHGRGLKKAESEIERIARTHGADVAQAVREQAIRFYEGLVGSSVHELRAILTAIRGDVESFVTDVGKGCTDQAVAKFAPRLRDTMQFMEHLLDDMRSYSEFPQEKRHTEILAEMVQQALHLVQASFADAGKCLDDIDVMVDVPPELSLPASRAQIIMAIRNFIKNAHEAILEDDGREGKGFVKITAQRDGDFQEIRIADNGMGLSEKELSDVRQFIPGNSSKNNGTGFGLPIAQRYVSFHGGTLEIQSKDGMGTTVVVRLPAESSE
jgi:signal transduction histidine kinase